MAFEKKDLPKKSDGLAEWYNRVVLQAELADYGPAKGTMIFRPYGYALWEGIQKYMDGLIKANGVENAYFPMFIPESLLAKEKDHLEGFSPELAVVTIGGGEELQERLVLRPTSETIMYDTLGRWIHSWRDLPVKLNQWSNVVRWEKRTYLFLRTSEFLWQEGHTAHATHEEAKAMVTWAMDMYKHVYRDLLAIPGYVGKKSESEKFAGADMTLTYESLMPEGKALQSSTSHDLGQNFSKPFNIMFQSQARTNEYVWQTSWGLSTRSIGGLIMTHGDDQGLRLPPRVAPIQVVIIPVKVQDDVVKFAEQVSATLSEHDIRVSVDTRENESLGYKINKWELKGVPLRIEIGPREMSQNVATMARRDTFEKFTIATDDALAQTVQQYLDAIQQHLLEEAELFLKDNTHRAASYEEFKTIMAEKRGFVVAAWCGSEECATKIKEETKATTRCLPLDGKSGDYTCVYCGRPARDEWYFAQSY